jgi:hypothetical protein
MILFPKINEWRIFKREPVFALFFKRFEGIILSMNSKTSFLKTTVGLSVFLYLSGMFLFPIVPKAHALYWEDEADTNNDPSETKSRPDHFSLFDWVGDAENDSKKRHYRDLDNHDTGPGVNNGDRAGVVIISGVVGLGAGIFLGSAFAGNGNATSGMFVGGALGLGAGVAVGALIMPGDYNVDQHAYIDFMKQRQAWLEDPVLLNVQKPTQHPQMNLSFKF